MWIYRFGLELILFLRCLGVLSIRRLWAFRSSLRLVYFFFIQRMTKRVCWLSSIFLLFLFLLLGTDKALAQTGCDDPETPIHEICTPEPTWEQLYKTGTPRPAEHFECPQGSIAGWGTVTPNPLWLSNCSRCLPTAVTTPIPGYTSVAPTPTGGGGSVTSVPATITPTPGNQTTTQISSAYNGMYPNLPDHTKKSFPATWGQSENQYTDAWSNYGFDLRFKLWGSSNQEIQCGAPAVTLYLNAVIILSQAHGWSPITQDLKFMYWQCPGGNEVRNTIQTDSNGATFTITITDLPLTVNPFDSTDFGIVFSRASTGYYFQIQSLTLSLNPMSAPTPVPTVSGSSCYGVNGTGTNEGEGNSGVVLPTPRLGPSSCFTVSSFSLNTSAISWIPGFDYETLTFPGLSVCFRAIEFGELNFLGVNVDLDVLALVMGVVVVLRFIFRT